MISIDSSCVVDLIRVLQYRLFAAGMDAKANYRRATSLGPMREDDHLAGSICTSIRLRRLQKDEMTTNGMRAARFCKESAERKD